MFGSSVLFYGGIAFSYYVMAPAALNFFISYAEGVVESLWSIDQYFEFVLILMFSTGVSFQVGGRGRQGRKGKGDEEGMLANIWSGWIASTIVMSTCTDGET